MERAAHDRFAAFATAHGPYLHRIARGLVGDWHEAEDLTQTTLARLYRAWPKVEAANDPLAYARRALVNASRSAWRRRRPVVVLTDRPPDRAAPDPAERDDPLLAAIARLPARQRAIVVLRYWDDLTEQAVADALGITVGTVKSQTARALVRLRADTGLSLEHQP